PFGTYFHPIPVQGRRKNHGAVPGASQTEPPTFQDTVVEGDSAILATARSETRQHLPILREFQARECPFCRSNPTATQLAFFLNWPAAKVSGLSRLRFISPASDEIGKGE